MKDMQGNEIKLRDRMAYVVIRNGFSCLHVGKIITIADNYVRIQEDQTNIVSCLKKSRNVLILKEI